MPAKSQQQFKFMKAVQEGYIKTPGLSPQKAVEFTQGVKMKTLPKFAKLKSYLSKGKK